MLLGSMAVESDQLVVGGVRRGLGARGLDQPRWQLAGRLPATDLLRDPVEAVPQGERLGRGRLPPGAPNFVRPLLLRELECVRQES